MKASIKLRDERKPLLRAKVPLNIMNFPFQSGVVAGESKELSLNLATFFESGPSLKFSYRPNDSLNPFSINFKTGIGHFGSPHKSPLTMTAQFNFIAPQNPSFFIHFNPEFGDFSLKKSHSSKQKSIDDDDSFVNVGFLPAAVESKAAAVNRVLKGTEVSATTSIPIRDHAMVNLRWGLRVPQDGIRVPQLQLVMNKIGIEHVGRSDWKAERSEEYEKVCLDVKKQLEAIQAENGVLGKAVSDLRSDLAAGKMKYSSDAAEDTDASSTKD